MEISGPPLDPDAIVISATILSKFVLLSVLNGLDTIPSLVEFLLPTTSFQQ